MSPENRGLFPDFASNDASSGLARFYSFGLKSDLTAAKMVIPPMKRNGSGKSMNKPLNHGMDLEITASSGFAGLTRQVVSVPCGSFSTIFRMDPTPTLLDIWERKKS